MPSQVDYLTEVFLKIGIEALPLKDGICIGPEPPWELPIGLRLDSRTLHLGFVEPVALPDEATADVRLLLKRLGDVTPSAAWSLKNNASYLCMQVTHRMPESPTKRIGRVIAAWRQATKIAFIGKQCVEDMLSERLSMDDLLDRAASAFSDFQPQIESLPQEDRVSDDEWQQLLRQMNLA